MTTVLHLDDNEGRLAQDLVVVESRYLDPRRANATKVAKRYGELAGVVAAESEAGERRLAAQVAQARALAGNVERASGVAVAELGVIGERWPRLAGWLSRDLGL